MVPDLQYGRSDMSGTDPSGRSLLSRVGTGAALFVGGSLAMRILAMFSLAILARVLEPADFGVVAGATAFLGVMRALVNNQFHLALMRLPKIDEDDLDTAFTLSLIWALIASSVLFLLSNPMAGLINSPQAAPVLRLMALVPLAEGLRSPAFMRFERDLRMGPTVSVDVFGQFLQYATSITLAIVLGSYWALVFGLIVGAVVRTVMSHIIAPFRPRLTAKRWREFTAFGGWLSGAGFAGYFISSFDILVVSNRLGTASAGFYHNGAELVRMATDYLAMPLSRAAYPGMSSIADQPERLNRSVRLGLEVVMGLMLPIGVGLSVLAHRFIPLLLGQEWGATVPIVRILAPFSAFACLSFVVQSVILVKGDTRDLFLRNLLVACLQAPMILVGLAQFGLVGAAIGRAGGMTLLALVTLGIGARLVQQSMLNLLMIPWRSYVACAVMAAVVLAADAAWTSVLPNAAVLPTLVGAATGAVVYSGTLILLWTASGRPEGFEKIILGRVVRTT